MERYKFILSMVLGFVVIGNLYAIPPAGWDRGEKPKSVDSRNDCILGTNSIELNINNVRARLLSSGDIWWDRNRAQYIVPKPTDPSIPGAASIFAGGVWLGGRDGAGNLKVAVSTFPNINRTDFWPGPLTPEGTTNRETCATWDVFWTVYLDEILVFRDLFLRTQEEGGTVPLDSVPLDLLKWPGFGNPFFLEYNGFNLPQTDQPLAGFYDANDDGLYNPLDGDLPAIEIRGCPITVDQIPDMMVFWIYNDNGNTHTASNGLPMQMEVQAQAFAYQTSDEINDMTFIRYKLLNRAAAPISDTYFAMWVDPDLGCSDDDYVGCDTSRSLAIIYNSDAVDGTSGCTCGSQITYCTNIPILGVDYFRGPLADSIAIDSFGNEMQVSYELGMSSFTYYNREDPNINKTDPVSVEQHYNYLTGRWRDGNSFTEGGDGYDPNGRPIRYAFPGEPNNINGWSMCSQGLPPVDLRTLQASGPFVLNVGRINELIVGLPWVPNQNYPCPSFADIFAADDKAQALFDNCFDLTDGPDAPDLSIIELDREVIFTLTNANFPTSNNQNEQYEEIDTYAPNPPFTEEQRKYRFQGYKVYQLISSEVGRSEFNNPSRARLVLQMDIRDSISKIYNWIGVPGRNETENFVVPQLMVDGANDGIRKTFRITNDAFAVNDVRLVNHRKYYYSVVAYAHNEYLAYNPNIDTFYQANPYLEGRRNIQTYTVIPRKVINLDLNSAFGDGVVVTRIDGKGNPMAMLELSEESKLAVEDFGNFDGEITYTEGRGPVTVSIFNPIDVVDGDFSLKLLDDNLSDDRLDPEGFWELTNLETGEVVFSDVTLAEGNEQLLSQYGFSIILNYGINAGDRTDPRLGVVGSSLTYDNNFSDNWIRPITNNTFRLQQGPGFQAQLFTYLLTGSNGSENYLDPNQQFNRIANENGFAPFLLTTHATDDNTPIITPAGSNSTHPLARTNFNFLGAINNVDIVFTNDKSLWSRCVVVETSHRNLRDFNFEGSQRLSVLAVKGQPSVSREVDADGNPVREGSSTGFSWFPGYAIDVETGQRLNIFFGEASVFSEGSPRLTNESFPSGRGTGNDMIFNPTADENLTTLLGGDFFDMINYVMGGHHYIYVTNTAYDECAAISSQLRGSITQVRNAYRAISWAGMMMLSEDTELLSYADGLIPNKARMSLRVGKQYGVTTGNARTGDGYPEYRFTIEGKQALPKTGEVLSEALDLINVVPNPYYSNSEYEVNSNLNVVKITNLPYQSEVSIYTLNGDFVRKFDRNVEGIPATRANQGVLFRQPVTNIEWDMNNSQGIPIASGIYLIHVVTPNDGERVLKWLCVNRPFDSSSF